MSTRNLITVNCVLYYSGTYRDRISHDGHVLNDHMLLGSVVATILILDNTAQVSIGAFERA